MAIMEENEEIGEALHLNSIQSLSAKQGQHMDNTRYVQIVDGVAIISLIGPIYPRANMMTASGATSIAQYTADFVRAYNDSDIRAIIHRIDSPGGDVRGIGDAAKLMFKARKENKKPIWSFAEGYCCSAAYYEAATGETIYASESSMVGSIGTVLTARKNSKDEIEIVSSISPNKRPNPETEEGLAVLKEQVDDLGNIFKNDMKKYRGITEKVFTSNYGQGAIKIGPRALALGMIDEITTLGDLVDRAARAGSKHTAPKKKKPEAHSAVSGLLKFSDEEITDMGLKNLEARFQAADDNDEVEEETSAILDADTVEESEDDGPSLAERRAELEDRFEETAAVFAEKMVVRNHILPAEAMDAAGLMLTAKVDDALIGGKVQFVNKDGEVAEGTRAEQITAMFQNRPQHTLTQKAIKGIKKGDIKATVLAETPKDSGKDAEEDGPISEERRKQLLGSSTQGQSVLRRENNNGNGNK